MQTNTSALGIALMCNPDGVILQVLHNDLGLAASEMVGKPFPLLVPSSSFQKALSFLVELRTRRTAFNWEFDLLAGSQMILAQCAGVAIGDGLLIMAAQTRFAVEHLLGEMMSINNAQTDLLRTSLKDQAELVRDQPEREMRLYDKFSSVNNELVTLQRELAKKNGELERLNAEVQRLASVDELTHLYNRRGFFELGRREVARAQRFGQPLAAIMFDLDHFKRINDIYGHATGDQVLEAVATRCSQQLRNVDICGRYGGEEFSVLLPETKLAGARVTAERLRQLTADEPIQTGQGAVTVTISLGVATLNEKAPDLAELLQHADQALYQAKEAGRNRVEPSG